MTAVASNNDLRVLVTDLNCTDGKRIIGIWAPKKFFKDGLKEIERNEKDGKSLKSDMAYFYFEADDES